MIPTIFWIELLVVLICLFYGARKGGMALGLISGIGLIVLVFCFHVKPGKPPVDVILTILAVIMGSAGAFSVAMTFMENTFFLCV